MRPILRVLATGLALVVFGACDDSNQDRQAIEQVLASLQQTYRDRSSKALLALVSKDYRADMGTPDPSDDLDYADLTESVPATFAHAKQIEIEMQIQAIQITKDRATVDCRQQVGYLLVFDGQERWSRHDDKTRIELVRQDRAWKVLSGL